MDLLAPDEGCPACLPSSNSAYRFITQQEGSLPLILLHFAGRSAIVATGLAIAGLRGDQLLKASVVSGAAIELSLLTWAYFKARRGAVDSDQCIPCTPGGDNARDVIEGDPRAILFEQAFFLERVALVALGCFFIGVRQRELLKSALLGGLTMEAFILGYQLAMKKRQETKTT